MTATAFSHLSTLADPTRARLLLALDGRELTVGELVAALQLPQSTVSRHLKHLGDDGWVTSRPDGTARYYRKVPDLLGSAEQLWQVVRGDLDQSPRSATDLQRVLAVVAERSRRSREFFATETGTWEGVRRELFGSGADLALMATLLEPDIQVGDFGCGDGRLTTMLADHVRHVVAVDASSEMLAAARARAGVRPNVEWHLADLGHLPVAGGSLDLAILSLVLAYLPEPERVVAEAARTLKPGGRLVIMDMLPHERDELRRSLGHAWSGFPEAQMREWMRRAGVGEARIRAVPADPEAKGPGLFVATGRRPQGSQAEGL